MSGFSFESMLLRELERRFMYEYDRMSLEEKFGFLGMLLRMLKTEYEQAMVKCISELLSRRGQKFRLLYNKLGLISIEVNGTIIIVDGIAKEVIVRGSDRKALELAKEIASLTNYKLTQR